MSPEQCRGAGRVDARTDMYSLGSSTDTTPYDPPRLHKRKGFMIMAGVGLFIGGLVLIGVVNSGDENADGFGASGSIAANSSADESKPLTEKMVVSTKAGADAGIDAGDQEALQSEDKVVGKIRRRVIRKKAYKKKKNNNKRIILDPVSL